jgi:CelD/BcsL family acetyltransferase involved in cellulose biosynthesis
MMVQPLDASEPARVRDAGTEPDPPIQVDVISSFEDLVQLEPAWNRLLDDARVDHPFLTHEWIRSWWESFGARNRLHTMVAIAGAEVVGIAPMMLTQRRMYGLKARCLELITNPHTPRSGILVARSRPEARRAILDRILASSDDWDVMTLSQVAVESALIDDVKGLSRLHGLLCGVWASSRSPYVERTGEWRAYEASLSRKHRSNIRNRLARLEKLGPVTYETIQEPGALPAAIEEGLRLEAAAWKRDAGSAILSDPRSERFYRSLAARSMSRGWLALQFLSVGGRRIAFCYSLVYGNRCFLLKPGYDPGYRQYSPGAILCYMTMQRAFNLGLAEIDFAGEADEWKMQWTRRTRPHAWMYVFAPRVRTRLIHDAKFRFTPWLRRKKFAAPLRARLGVRTVEEVS